MTRFRILIASIVTSMIVGAAPLAAAAPASAQIVGGPDRGWALGPGLNPEFERGVRRNGDGIFQTVAASCSGAAAEAAAKTGGQVLSVSSRNQGGQTVCVVTLLVPGKDGGRPRKMTVTIRS